jgi:hypothetical protein
LADDGTECNDGLYCTDPDVCTQGVCGGTQRDCSEVFDDCYYGQCDEASSSCVEGDPRPPTEDCDDYDPCTDNGKCNGAGICRIEGYCDEIVDAACTAPAVEYLPLDPGATDCRFGLDRLGVQVQVDAAAEMSGGLVPVRVVLDNAWVKDLYELRVVLTLNPADVEGVPGGKVAYVLDSALLQGGEAALGVTTDEDSRRVIFRLFDSEEPLKEPLPAFGGRWVLGFMLLRGATEDGVFKLEVGAPCESDDAVVGCHYGYGEGDLQVRETGGDVHLQLMAPSKYASTSGQVVDDGDNIAKKLRSPVLGCQCGAAAVGVELWVLLLLSLVALRRRSRR